MNPTGLVPRTTCPPAGSDAALFLVSVDLRSLLYTEAVLPLRHQIVAFVPNEDGHLPVPRAVDVSADGSVGLLVEYRGALVTPAGDIVAPARGLAGASADVNLALAQFAPDGTLADVISVVGTRQERGVGLAVSPTLEQLVTLETLSPELTIFRGAESIGRVERPADRTPPQSVVLLRVSPTGEVDWTHRIDAVDGAKPELTSWPADFSSSRGARLAVGAASGQGVHFDTNRAPVAAPLVSIHWVDFASNGELIGRRVVYSARDPHSFFRFFDTPSFRGGGFGPVGATTAGLLQRPYTGPGGFDVLRIFFDFALNQVPQDVLMFFNSNDRVRCSSD